MYPPGARLPTEGELCSKFDVSRVTVRKALDELGDKGYLVRKPGKGTFVVEKKIQRTLSGVIGFTEMCRMMGYKPGAKTVKIALEQPTEEQTKLLI
jgi:GntR family transcriptional regulator